MRLETRLREAAQGIHRAVQTKERSMRTDERRGIERFDRFRRRNDRNRAIGTIVFVGVLVALAATAAWILRDTSAVTPDQRGTPVSTNLGTVTITKAGCTLDGTTDAAAGPFTLTVANETAGPRDILVFDVATDRRFEKLLGYVEHPNATGVGFRTSRLDALIVMGGQTLTTVDRSDSLVLSGDMRRGAYVIACSNRPAPMSVGAEWIVGAARPSDLIGPIVVR
jgi:hypothetical protein